MIPPVTSVVVISTFVVPPTNEDASLTVIAPEVVFKLVPGGKLPLAIVALVIAPLASLTVARTSLVV